MGTDISHTNEEHKVHLGSASASIECRISCSSRVGEPVGRSFAHLRTIDYSYLLLFVPLCSSLFLFVPLCSSLFALFLVLFFIFFLFPILLFFPACLSVGKPRRVDLICIFIYVDVYRSLLFYLFSTYLFIFTVDSPHVYVSRCMSNNLST